MLKCTSSIYFFKILLLSQCLSCFIICVIRIPNKGFIPRHFQGNKNICQQIILLQLQINMNVFSWVKHKQLYFTKETKLGLLQSTHTNTKFYFPTEIVECGDAFNHDFVNISTASMWNPTSMIMKYRSMEFFSWNILYMLSVCLLSNLSYSLSRFPFLSFSLSYLPIYIWPRLTILCGLLSLYAFYFQTTNGCSCVMDF